MQPIDYRPSAILATHEVSNQPLPPGDRNLFEGDAALADAVRRLGGIERGSGAWTRLSEHGERCGSVRTRDAGRLANRNPPELRAFDRYGHRLDAVEFHPAYHELLGAGIAAGIASGPWAGTMTHLERAALFHLSYQADAGTCCPMSMTFAAVPALLAEPGVAAEWLPRILSGAYDPRMRPAGCKGGATIGMAMTEKQGGSDVRTNTTTATPDGDGAYVLHGHKWFCSAPMSDAFLTLAQLDGALTCFLVPRWRPDGERNAIHLMRLKDKLGDRSNASSEIEYHGAHAVRVGERGRGVRTIVEMVHHTRLDCVVGSAAGMRSAVLEALAHASQRTAFQKRLVDHPAMAKVLTDLAIESEAATALAMRLAHAFDRAGDDPSEAALARLATPVAKYWVCKRQPGVVNEALECHGGAGFVEDGPMPLLFRQSPLNAVWEGSGNVIALDALRAVARDPGTLDAVIAETADAAAIDRRCAAHVAALERWRRPGALHDGTARRFCRDLALALGAAALAATSTPAMLAAFCATRLGDGGPSGLYGEFTAEVALGELIERAYRPRA